MENKTNYSIEINTNLDDSFRSMYSYYAYVSQDKLEALKQFISELNNSHCLEPGKKIKDFPNLKMTIYRGKYSYLHRLFTYLFDKDISSYQFLFMDFLSQLFTQTKITEDSFYQITIREYKNA